LSKQGFNKIIGLRDMYSKAYRKKSKTVINQEVARQFIEAVSKIIAGMNNPDKINFHFAIMELDECSDHSNNNQLFYQFNPLIHDLHPLIVNRFLKTSQVLS
jgi:hypothetical protein